MSLSVSVGAVSTRLISVGVLSGSGDVDGTFSVSVGLLSRPVDDEVSGQPPPHAVKRHAARSTAQTGKSFIQGLQRFGTSIQN
ncbi:MAG: hypothetical protein OXC62_15755 [Aestuariivita sp.]|nr:hypothetical protein [Aestuariivita sp.]